MCDAGYDPLCLGIKNEIPPRVYMPLFQLGITNIVQVLAPASTSGSPNRVVIPASALARSFPKHMVKATRALNALTLILNGIDFRYDAVREARAIDLALQQRTISNTVTLDRIADLVYQPLIATAAQRSVASSG